MDEFMARKLSSDGKVSEFCDEEFTAKRLRRLAVLCGISVPPSDEALLNCAGSVIGMVCRSVEEYFNAGRSPVLFPPDWMVISATRYAIGRMTYVVKEACDFLVANWGTLEDKTKGVIRQDVEEAFERGHVGMDMDREQWERVRRLWER